MKMARIPVAGWVAALAVVFASSVAVAGPVTQLWDFSDFQEPELRLTEFEGGANTDMFTFANGQLVTANTAQLSRSGTTFYADFSKPYELTILMQPGVYEVGLYFGNDDAFDYHFDRVTARLALYDASDVLIGQVTRGANHNDLIDQFIGARSDTEVARAVMIFDKATGNSFRGMAIDDFGVGFRTSIVVPLPTAGLTGAVGLAIVALAGFARRRRQTR